MNKRLTIIIPAFNEENGIRSTIQSLLSSAKKNDWNILVINDGSFDNTKAEVESFKEDSVLLINHPYNKGYGAAIKTGIRAAQTDFIALYDADGQHNSADLEAMWSKRGDFDMVIGMRGKNSHQDWMRKPGKWILSRTANLLTGAKIPDLNCGLRIIKREVIINKLHLLSDSFSFSTTSTVALMNMGYFVDYFPIKVNKRIGKSTVNQIKHGTSTIMLVIRLIMLFNPLKVFLPASIFFITVGLIYEIIWGIILAEGIDLLATAVFLLITGVLIFFFGLIADQISEIRKWHEIDNLKDFRR